jgi:hypothetical protein
VWPRNFDVGDNYNIILFQVHSSNPNWSTKLSQSINQSMEGISYLVVISLLPAPSSFCFNLPIKHDKELDQFYKGKILYSLGVKRKTNQFKL